MLQLRNIQQGHLCRARLAAISGKGLATRGFGPSTREVVQSHSLLEGLLVRLALLRLCLGTTWPGVMVPH